MAEREFRLRFVSIHPRGDDGEDELVLINHRDTARGMLSWLLTTAADMVQEAIASGDAQARQEYLRLLEYHRTHMQPAPAAGEE